MADGANDFLPPIVESHFRKQRLNSVRQRFSNLIRSKRNLNIKIVKRLRVWFGKGNTPLPSSHRNQDGFKWEEVKRNCFLLKFDLLNTKLIKFSFYLRTCISNCTRGKRFKFSIFP